MPRPYAVALDCTMVGRDAAHRIMTAVFFWSDRYSKTVLDGISGGLVVEHPFSSHEIAETKMILAHGVLSAAGIDVAGVTIRPTL